MKGYLKHVEYIGAGTIAVETVDIDGGAIDATPIGAATPAAGAFTTLGASGAATLAAVTASGLATFNGAVATNDALTVDGTGGQAKITGLPTSDPAVEGALYRNSSGQLFVSLGA